MAKLFSKKTTILISSIFSILTVLILCAFIWPVMSESVVTWHLKQVFSQETQPLLQPVNAIMQGAAPKSMLECDDVSHTYTKTQLYCQDVRAYDYKPEPLSDASRPKVVAEAAALDKALLQNGWTIDRPQDAIKTVAASIPTAPFEAFHGGGVPFHKNVGDISCNFEVSFDGPTDGISPGVVNINQFSCQQHLSYFMLHTSNYTNSGFGG